MEKKVPIPEGVDLEVKERKVIVSGKKGRIERNFNDPRFNKKIEIKKEGNNFIVSSNRDDRKTKAFVGTVAAHVKNMITGVTKGYCYVLTINYVHFPMTVEIKDKRVIIRNFLGEKGYREARIIGDAEVKVDKDKVIVTGINKDDVGQTSSNIEAACRVSGRDRRVFQDGIFLTERKTME